MEKDNGSGQGGRTSEEWHSQRHHAQLDRASVLRQARELGEAWLKRIQVHGFGFRWQLNGIKSRQRVYDIVWRWTKRAPTTCLESRRPPLAALATHAL